MSGEIKAKASVELKADRFTGPARDIQRQTQSMGQTGATAFNKIGQGANAATVQVKRSAIEINAARTATLGLAGSVAGLAASFVGLETSISNIPKRLNAIKKAEVGLDRATNLAERKTLALKKAQLQLDKARSDGKKTLEEISLLEENLNIIRLETATAMDDLSAKQEDLNLKHDDYADTLKLFATSVGTTILTAFTSITIMLTQAATQAELTTGAFIKMKFASIGLSRANIAAAFSFGTLRAAMTLVMRHPLMLVGIAAASVAMIIYEKNILGVRDAMSNLAGTELPAISDMFGMLGGFILPEATGATDDLNASIGDTNDLLTGLGDGAGAAGDSIGGLSDNIGDLTLADDDLISSLNGVNSGLSEMEKNAGKAGKAIDDLKKKRNSAISSLQVGAEEHFSEELFRLGLASPGGAIVSQTGRNLIGFRGNPLTISGVPGSEEAIANAMARFGISRAEAERLTTTSRTIQSRILSGSTSSSIQPGSLGNADPVFIQGLRDAGFNDIAAGYSPTGGSSGDRRTLERRLASISNQTAGLNKKQEFFDNLQTIGRSDASLLAQKLGIASNFSGTSKIGLSAAVGRTHRAGIEAMGILERTGVSLDDAFPKIASLERAAMRAGPHERGRINAEIKRIMDAYHARVAGNFRTAQELASIEDQIFSIRPDLVGTEIVKGKSLSFAQNRLAEEQSRLQNIIATLGISQSEVISIQATLGRGTQEIKNRLEFVSKLEAMSGP